MVFLLSKTYAFKSTTQVKTMGYVWEFDATQAEQSILKKLESKLISIDDAIILLEELPELISKYSFLKDAGKKTFTKDMVRKIKKRCHELKKLRDSQISIS